MAVTTSSSGRAQAERAARRLLAIGMVTMIPAAVILVWVLGFGVRPHRVGFASIVTAIWFVIISLRQWSIYRVRMKRASRL